MHVSVRFREGVEGKGGGGAGRAKNADAFRKGPKLCTARGSSTSVGKA